jgi:hypothetical protein
MAWGGKTRWTQEQIDDLKKTRERMMDIDNLPESEKPFAQTVILLCDWQLSRLGPDGVSDDRLWCPARPEEVPMEVSEEVTVPKEWIAQLGELVEKLPMHTFAREAIRSQLVLTVMLEVEKFQQMPPEMLDELLRLNKRTVTPPQS